MRSAVPAAVLLSLLLAACGSRKVDAPSDASPVPAGPDASGLPDTDPQPDAGPGPDASTPDAGPDASVPNDGCAGEVGVFYVERMNGILKVMARCNGMAEVAVLDWYPTEEGCAATVRGVADGRITYDKAQAAACLALIRSNQITCDEMPVATGPCMDAFVGKVPAGGTCYAWEDCAGLGMCSATPLSCPGTCTVRPGLGQPCPDQTCIEGLACLDGTCRQIAAVGESCNRYRGPACPAYAWCDASGTCAPRKVSGACQDWSECVAGYGCIRGTDGVRACAALKAPGQPCRVGAYECMTLSYCARGTCQPYSRIGGTCSLGSTATSETGYCLDGMCDGSVCAPFLAPGQSCLVWSDCGVTSNYSECDPATNECVGPCKPRG